MQYNILALWCIADTFVAVPHLCLRQGAPCVFLPYVWSTPSLRRVGTLATDDSRQPLDFLCVAPIFLRAAPAS
mgnify:FL=1